MLVTHLHLVVRHAMLLQEAFQPSTPSYTVSC